MAGSVLLVIGILMIGYLGDKTVKFIRNRFIRSGRRPPDDGAIILTLFSIVLVVFFALFFSLLWIMGHSNVFGYPTYWNENLFTPA
jgi:hypothetical protein